MTYLECPVCLLLPRSRIFSCVNSHQICEHCYSMPGCNVEVKKDQVQAHELKCIFRPVPCPVTSCQLKILFKDIFAHVQSRHYLRRANPLAAQPDISHHISQHCLDAVDLKCDLFFWEQAESKFYLVFVKKNSLWYSWVTIEGDREAASSWIFSAKVKNAENKMALKFTGVVHPIDLTVE